ncbi:ATP-binding protein [Kitasatospora viridis]|uniref:histidine kinase n=1 Tax=Kitasatospora viridis TaxID=281105 RepID=A0A561UBL6_9ACTN|nr:ATP-binding protein [Kitasatospora viridis]TWF96752.1 signal transduction histidine kinase [Kitasatospora viridis]
MTIASRKPPSAGRPDRVPARRLRRSPLLGRPLVLLPGLATLTGCSAQSGATEAVGGAVAVVLIGATAVVVRRVTARPLERARARADRNLSQLLDERAGLVAERDRLAADRDAQQSGRQQLARDFEELRRLHHELTAAHGTAVERMAELGAEREQLAAERDLLTAERDELAKERDELQGSVDATFVNLAMRTLTLVERQLVLIEALEGREADAAQLDSLFRLDHLATRMRRNSENMLLLAGLENSQRSRKTVTLLDVARAAVSEIERYERVKLGFLAAVRLTGAVADDTSHLLAELLENATAFSPPQEQVEVGGWLLDNGELMISVSDRGIGLPPERMRAINEQLAEPTPEDRAERRDALLAGALTGRSMGLFVVARLAARHGLRVQLRENGRGGGVTAMVVLPREALHQDGVSSADLDDQRRAERSVAADAARAAAVAAESLPAAPVVPVVPVQAAAEPPALPRRRGAHAAGAGVGDGAAVEPGAVEPAVAEVEVVESAAAEPPPLPRRRAAHAAPQQPVQPPVFDDPPTQQLMLRQLRDGLAESVAADRTAEPAQPETGPEAEADSAEAPELPRRVPRGAGLPGTGEAPTSGLRRATAPAPAPAAAAGTPDGRAPGEPDAAVEQGAAAAPVAPPSGSARVDAEELRRRLGGFQSGLRRAARETAAAERPDPEEQDR